MFVLEELHGPLVFLRGLTRRKRAEVFVLAALRIDFARIEPVLTRFQFADHGSAPGKNE